MTKADDLAKSTQNWTDAIIYQTIDKRIVHKQHVIMIVIDYHTMYYAKNRNGSKH